MKILILYTGNSCRSQMAYGFLQSFDPNITVCSAATEASGKLSTKAVSVMKEAGIDISQHTSDRTGDRFDSGKTNWRIPGTDCRNLSGQTIGIV